MQNMMNPNKQIASVLLNDKGQAQEEQETVNPDQGLIDAAGELVKAIEKKDPSRIARVFKAMLKMCDEYESEED